LHEPWSRREEIVLNDFQLIVLVMACVAFGALIAVFVQWTVAARALSRDVAETSRQVGELVAMLKPTAHRIERLGAASEQSEGDLRRLQAALHTFSGASVRFSKTFSEVSALAGVAVPIVAAAIERWSERPCADATAEGARSAGSEDNVADLGSARRR
jgi:hypothetical protein